MDFRILGPLEVVDGVQTLPLGGRRARALFALLLLRANETLSADRLIDELWGERPPAGAVKTLQVQISRLRKALGGEGGAPDLIVTRDGGYELVIDPDQVDARRFERLVADGRAELAADRAASAAKTIEEALELWRGAPLADLAYEPFVQSERSRLEELRVTALEHLIEAKLVLGRHAEVVEQLELLIGEHPYRERLRAQLMLALYREERQADALQVYQDARMKLVEDLGIEPGERLRELERAILAQEPSLRAPVSEEHAPAAGDAGGATSRRAFVGRERELGQLLAGLDGACAGSGRLVLLAGEPGIGKSRLADALIEQARARDAVVLVGRSWEAGGTPAYWPWIQALRSYLRDAGVDELGAQLGANAADLAPLLPELRELSPQSHDPAAEDGAAARFRLFEAARALLHGAAAARPLTIFLDDVHAADEPSLLLLQYVARGLEGTHLLIVVAYRDVDPSLRDPLTSALAELVREPHTVQIALTGLTASQVAEYVEVATGVTPDRHVVDAIHAETDGNPLFVAELVQLLAAEGQVDGTSSHLRIPPGVRAVIGRRIARLSEPCRTLLLQVSVMGREFSLDALTELTELTPDGVIDVLNEAMAERVLDEVPGAPGRIRFRHVLIRDALYEELTAARRMQLHKKVGHALEAIYASDPEPHLAELARHFVASAPLGVEDKALDYTRRAGDRAAGQLAFEEAARHYEIALTLMDDHLASCELLLALGDAEARAGDAPAAKRAFREAAELADREGFANQLARAAVGYGGRFAWARARADPALVPLLERALAAIDKRDVRTHVTLLARLASAGRDDPLRERRGELGREALRVARESGDAVALASAVEGHWIAVEGPVEHSRGEGVAAGEELISLGNQIGDKEKVFAGHDHRLHNLWALADRAGVDAGIAALGALAAELRQPAQHWDIGATWAMLALMEGRFEEAETLIATTLAIGERAESWNAHVSHRLSLFVLRRAQGRLGEIEDLMRRSVHEYPSLPRFACALVHVYGELGREREVRATLDELLARDLAHEYVDAEWVFSIALLADPCARFGDADATEQIYSLLLPYELFYAQAPVESVFGAVARGLGVLATALRRFDDAERHLNVAIETERKMRAPPWLAHAQHDLATMMLARGDPPDREAVRTLITDAVAGYRAHGMDVWARRAEELPAAAARP